MKKYFANEQDNISRYSPIYGFVWEAEKETVPNKRGDTKKYSSVKPSTLYRPCLICINPHLSWMSMWLIEALILEGGRLSLTHLPPACVWPNSRLGNRGVPFHGINRGGCVTPSHTEAAAPSEGVLHLEGTRERSAASWHWLAVEWEGLWHWRREAVNLILYERNAASIECFWYINGFLVFPVRQSHVKVEWHTAVSGAGTC